MVKAAEDLKYLNATKIAANDLPAAIKRGLPARIGYLYQHDRIQDDEASLANFFNRQLSFARNSAKLSQWRTAFSCIGSIRSTTMIQPANISSQNSI